VTDPRFDPARWAERRRPFDALEAQVVRLHLDNPDRDAEHVVGALRYVLSFARLTTIRNRDGVDVDVSGVNHLHAMQIQEALTERLNGAGSLWNAARVLPDLVEATRRARASILARLPIDRDALEAEVTTRLLAVVSGGGGGAGYVYPGCFEVLERGGLIPDLMVGTSIGALMSMFRTRRRRYDPAPMVSAARRLSWGTVFRVLEAENRYGLPATLRLYLRAALGRLFLNPDGEPLRLSDMEIPLYVIATGITVDALKHDLDYYEHFFDAELRRRSVRSQVRGVLKTIAILAEFLSSRDALKEIVLGRAPGTEEFDVLDAAGFSAAIPGVIHYDVVRPDARMHRLLDQLYATYGITRLGEGGMVANVAARVAWETAISGLIGGGRRNIFVLALDCFGTGGGIAWTPLQQIVRTSNVEAHKVFADLYLDFPRTLSPMNLVPSLRDVFTAMRWGRDRLQTQMPFVLEMTKPIPVLSEAG
jgi:predicted acylesterase/phospholipase RssA